MAHKSDHSIGFLRHYASLRVIPEEHRAQLAVAADDLSDARAGIDALHKAIRLIDAQLRDGEGAGIMYYLSRPYPGGAIVGHEDVVDLVRSILPESNGGAET